MSSDLIQKTTTALGGLRNHIATEAITAVQQYIPALYRKKRQNSIKARGEYIAKQLKSKDDHPIIWREYVKGDIRDHPERGGYKIVRPSFISVFPLTNCCTDEAWCLPIRPNLENALRLLFTVWHQGGSPD